MHCGIKNPYLDRFTSLAIGRVASSNSYDVLRFMYYHIVRGCDSAFALCFTGLSPHQVIVNENLRRITPTAKRERRQGPRKTETENI